MVHEASPVEFNMNPKGLLEGNAVYKPFRYPWAYDAWLTQNRLHWLPEEVPLGDDVKDWHNVLSDSERHLVTQIFRFFTLSDVEVNECYMRKYATVFKPTEVLMMLSGFSNIECVHMAAYSYLLDTIGMPETEYCAFLKYKEMKDKYDYMQSFTVENKREIAKTLAAFGGFTEGLQLFASFAILMNFPRFNKMKGMGQIVSWSVRDECVSEDTEILTPRGWVKFPELQDGERVAQFNPDTGEITYVVPSRVVRKPHKGKMHTHRKRQLDWCVTPNHDILYYTEDGAHHKKKASEFHGRHEYTVPVTGIRNAEEGVTYGRPLSAYEKILVAYAADGHVIVGDNRTGERCGYQRVTFSLTKQRKIDRLLALAAEAGVACAEIKPNERVYNGQVSISRKFTVDLNVGDAKKCMSDWVDLEKVDSIWGASFLQEITKWDGYESDTRSTYCSTEYRDIELAQAVAFLSGYSATTTSSEDDRSETYKTYHRISFWTNRFTGTGRDAVSGEVIDYDGMTYCVTVPTGCFVAKRNDRAYVTGNCLHCTNIIRLFHTFIDENPEIWDDELKAEIRQICQDIVAHEDAFIDLSFEMGPMEGMTAENVKDYIRDVANYRLKQLGLEPIYDVEPNPLPWLDDLLNANEHTNFFENRSTEYSRAATEGTWEDAWAAHEPKSISTDK